MDAEKNAKIKYIILLIGFTVLPLIMIEIGLMLFDFGFSFEVLITEESQTYSAVNPYLIDKYHLDSIGQIKSEISDVFLNRKPVGEIRIVVLGGSTAQGFPYIPDHAFAGMIEKTLPVYTRTNVKVINLAFSALSSFYVYDVSQKIKDWDIDYVVMYSGHNEFLGTVSALHSIPDLLLPLQELRIVQLIQHLIAPDSGGWVNADLMDRQYNRFMVELSSEDFQNVSKKLEENLSKSIYLFLENDVEIILIEPVSNYFFPPIRPSALTNTDLLDYLEQSTINMDRFSLDDFFEKKMLDRNTSEYYYLNALNSNDLNANHVIDDLKMAVDLDRLPFRMPPNFLSIFRKLELEFSGNSGFHFIPLEKIIFENLGIEGFSFKLFSDHLHFNIDGNRLLSALIVKEIIDSTDPSFIQEYLTEFKSDELFEMINLNQFMIWVYNLKLSQLFSNEVIRGMPIAPTFQNTDLKYVESGILDFFNAFALERLEDGDDQQTIFKKYYNFLVEENQLELAIDFAIKCNMIFPADLGWYDTVNNLLRFSNSENILPLERSVVEFFSEPSNK